jgi:hypothetical protein
LAVEQHHEVLPSPKHNSKEENSINTVDLRTEAPLDCYIREFEAFLGALERLLAGPGSYFDPETLPDPQLPEDFCTRYQALRDGAARDLSEIVRASLPIKKFEVTRGPEFPIQGCLLREEMNSMRSDVKACLAALRSR